nr:hypothetical protein [Tanacetum cinerariifolium]
MTTLAKFMIIAGANNRPPMLEKSLYDLWKSCMELYVENRENGRMILNSVQNGPLVWPTVVQEDGTTRTNKYEELSVAEKLQADRDLKATNIVLQGLVVPVFSQGDDPIAYLNKAMAFLKAVASSRQGQSYAGTGYKDNATSSGGNNTCGHARDTEDLDAYVYGCDDVSNAKAVLMANLSNYGSDVILEVPYSEPYYNDMDNQREVEEEHVEDDTAAQGDDTIAQADDAPEPSIPSPTLPTPPPQPPQDLPSTSQVKHTLPQSPQPEPQPQPQAQQQAADFPMSLLQEALDACVALTGRVEHLDYIKYALTVNPNIYVSCIKQFWNIVIVKQDNDVTRLQALVDKKKLVITEAAIRDVLRLDDAERVDCLPNEEIFAELVRMGYEKPSTKLTFYKAFFSSQWKFLIHTILQSMSAKRTSWNEFSSAMASAPQVFYDDTLKQVLGYQNPFYLKKAQRIKPTLYDGSVISTQHAAIPVIDNEETLILEELNKLSDDFGKRFVPQQELSAEQAFWLQTSNPNNEEFDISPGRIEAPSELPKEGEVEEEHVEDDTAAQGDDTIAQADDAPEPSIPSPTLPTPPPQPPQDLPSTSQVKHTLPQSPQPEPQPQPQAQQQAADFPMSLLQEALDACVALTGRVEHLEYDKVALALEITKLKRRVKKLEKGNRVKVLKLQRLKKVGTSQRVDTSEDIVMDDASNQERKIDEMNKDDVVALMDDKKEEEAKVFENDQVQGRQAESQAKIYKTDMNHASKVLSMQEDEPAEVHEVVDVVTTAKLITEVVTATSETITATSTIISAAEPQVLAATITVAPVRVAAASTRRRKGVVIRDPEEESTISSVTPADTKSKDKGKGIMVEGPKPLKKKQHVEMDEEYARKLHAELDKDIDWDVAIKHTKEQMEEEESRALQSINETPVQKAAKRRKLNEEVEDLKRHLEIMLDEDDDVYTEATPLARKTRWTGLSLEESKDYTWSSKERRYPLSTFTLDQMLNAVRLRVEEQNEMSLELLSEELSAIKQKLMLLDGAAEGRLMLLSQVKTVNEKCCC